MANLFFNDLEITGERNTLNKILLHIDAEALWAAKFELEDGDIEDCTDRLIYHYDCKPGPFIDSVERIAAQFPDAHFLLSFKNINESISGFAEYRDGREVAGNVFEDFGVD